MKYIFCIQILYIFVQHCNGRNHESPKAAAIEDPLFLTPYINSEQIDLARELASVKGLEPALESYSGFITVNETFNSNIFFWYFPAANNASTAPVIIWCEGGPGVSGLFSLFNENGPYSVDQDGELHFKEHSWHLTNSMIFLDSPVGAGFSFTDSEDGYLKSGTDSSHMHNFLTQFFTMFPDVRENDFYVAGVSFGGIFAPSLAHRIHTVNREGGFKINLKGVLVESGWSDPIGQVDYGNFLYQIGFLDEADRDYAVAQTEVIRRGIEEERFDETYQIWADFLFSDNAFFLNRTGLSKDIIYNFITLGREEIAYDFYIPFIEQEVVRNAIHVGSTPYFPTNPLVNSKFTDKGFKSVKPLLEELLDASEGYRILYYSGQLDVITYHRGVKNTLNGLAWAGSTEFLNAKPIPWRVENDVAGFVSSAGNLTFVLMRNAGHDANANQPLWGFDVMTRFTQNLPFA